MVALLSMPRRPEVVEQSDRRMFPRKEIQCRVQGRRIDHSLTARREPFVSLSTRDLSVGGLSAIADRPVQPGERITVFFPPTGGQRGWDAYGRVLRCTASAMGYRIAMEFDPLPAA